MLNLRQFSRLRLIDVKMSSYENLKVVELRQLCKSANLPSSGRKADLIASLQAKDRGETEHQASDSEISLSSGLELVNEQQAEEEGLDEAIGAESVSNSSNEIVALKLKLELARENRLALEIKERIHMNRSPTENGATVSANNHERELRGLLPKMSERDDDVISFFDTFERTLELYDVDVASYARLLPCCLSMKAAKRQRSTQNSVWNNPNNMLL